MEGSMKMLIICLNRLRMSLLKSQQKLKKNDQMMFIKSLQYLK